MATNTSSILINASEDKVWQVLTNPDLVKTWQYRSDLITDWAVKWEIGFEIEWQDTIFEQWGKVLKFRH